MERRRGLGTTVSKIEPEPLGFELGSSFKQLKESIKYLRDASLDLVRWTVDNSKREDLRIVRTPELEMLQTNRLLPPDESGVIRWDENPFRAVQGDGGHTESDGVWWMLPYWAGRYYGYIMPPQ